MKQSPARALNVREANYFLKSIPCSRKLLLLLCLISSSVGFAQDGTQIFDNSFVHEIDVTFYDNDYWDSLQLNYDTYNTFSGSDIPYLPAVVQIDGTTLDSVGMRFKGKSSYYYVNDKKPFKIDFNEFISGQNFDGLKKINLQNSLGDPAMIRDLMAYDLMRASGVPAPRVSFCRLTLNGTDWGLYKIIEQIDKTFLDNNFADDSGNLYKNQRWSELKWWGADPLIYKDTFELKTNTTEDDWSEFINLLDVINNSPDATFENDIQQIFNVDQFLHVLAVDIMTNNWDSYISNARNWYLYHEPASGKFHWIPWDYNLCFGGAISLSGNPYPPYDPNCPILADFQHHKEATSVNFTSHSQPPADSWSWDFGDGTSSSEQHPSHTFAEAIPYNVCLTASKIQGNEVCSQTRCNIVDMSFDPGTCFTIQSGDCPYDPYDPVFQKVIEEDYYCCEVQWDAFCFLAYQDLENAPPPEITSGNDYDLNYPLILDNPDKVLVDRLMAVPAFRERYLDISCILLEKHFNAELLYPKVDYFRSLLIDHIYTDSKYNYTTDYFEYDTGNGTGGGEAATIPALRFFMNQRFQQLEEQLTDTQHDCTQAYSPISWNEVVINEIMASSTELNGVPDSNGEYDDWIELYNNTNAPVNLTNFYLSDDLGFPKKWAFPQNTIIESGGYLIIWADKDLDQQGLHANFKLSKSGETILLSHEDGTFIDILTFDEQFDDVAYARNPNGVGAFTQQNNTFNNNNETLVNSTGFYNNPNILLVPNPVKDRLNIKTTAITPNQPVRISIKNTAGYTLHSANYLTSSMLSVDYNFGQLPSGIYYLEFDGEQQKSIHKFTVLP